MARLVLAAVCESAIIDRETNLVSYINLFEGVTVAELPGVFPYPVVVASIWERTADEPETLHFRLSIQTPGGEKQAVLEDSVEMKVRKHRLTVRVNPLTLPEAGTYHFILQDRRGDRWHKAADLSLEVALADDQEAD